MGEPGKCTCAKAIPLTRYRNGSASSLKGALRSPCGRSCKERNLIVINNAHRDFVFASRTRALKLRYICRLYAKELLLKNFPGYSPDRLLERMVELSLYTEEHLR